MNAWNFSHVSLAIFQVFMTCISRCISLKEDPSYERATLILHIHNDDCVLSGLVFDAERGTVSGYEQVGGPWDLSRQGSLGGVVSSLDCFRANLASAPTKPPLPCRSRVCRGDRAQVPLIHRGQHGHQVPCALAAVSQVCAQPPGPPRVLARSTP